MKFIKILICCVCLVSVFTVNCFALSSGTYSDLASTSSNVTNLINYAMSYDTFITSDYVVYQSAQYEYYIVWGDLTYNGTQVQGSDINYISYIRSGSGYDYTYSYSSGTDTNFTLIVSHIVTSNIPELGFTSSVYHGYKTNDNVTKFCVVMTAALFVVMCCSFRRSDK